jgi:hypothetical protein
MVLCWGSHPRICAMLRFPPEFGQFSVLSCLPGLERLWNLFFLTPFYSERYACAINFLRAPCIEMTAAIIGPK